MLLTKLRRFSTFVLLSLAIIGGVITLGARTPSANAATISTGTGQISVTLSQNPSSPAKVTAKRAADVTDIGKIYPAETVTLLPGTGAKATNQGYLSPVLAYSGYANNPAAGGGCSDSTGATYYNWNITVSGSATGSSTVRVACGTIVPVKIIVTLAGQKDTNGTIAGTATYQALKCSSNSIYLLLPPGATPDFANGNGTPLQIEGATGKYTISAITPGTYDLYIDCSYNPNNANIPSDTVLGKQNVIVTAGAITALNFDQNSIVTPPNNSIGCDSSGITLSWIVCPIIQGLAGAVDGIYTNVIKPVLQEDTNQTTATWIQTKAAWSNFRVYGDIFLVIALLVIVFGQSIGGGIIDAYSAKKILPRLLLAAILINLSYYIVVFMIDITNIVGGGLISLITTPFGFSGSNAFSLTPNGGTNVVVLGAIAGTATAAIVGGTAFLGWLWPFVLLPALLTFIAILVTVLLRRGLIILLIIISPVAFALYCLPNTEKYFKQWWDMLFKTLLVYPIIVAFFALSKIMSVLIAAGGGSSGVLSTFSGILSVIALLVPLFMIPFAFKISGGIIGQASQALNGLGKKAHQGILGNKNDPDSYRNKSKRELAAKYADNDLSGKAIGTRLNPTTLFGKRRGLRKASLGATKNMYQGIYGKQGMGAAMYEQSKDDSNIMGDLAHHATGAESRAAIDADIQAGKFKSGSADHQQRLFSSAAADRIGRNPAMRRRALMNPSTIGYAISEGETGWNEATSIMRSIAGNDEGTYRSMVNEFQYLAKSQAGRPDLAGATDGNDYSGDKAYRQLGLYEMSHGKPKAILAFGTHYAKKFATGTDVDKTSSAVFYKELEAMLPNSTGDVRDEIIKQRGVLEQAGVVEYMNSPATLGPNIPINKIRERVLDPSDPNKFIVRERDETWGDVAQRQSRAYERPDPNRIT